VGQRRKRPRILIADKEAVFCFGLTKLLGLEDDLRVVAQAENGEQLLALAETCKPDLVFVQTEIVREGAGNLLPQVCRILPQSKLVVVAAVLSEVESLRYVKAGASGVILRSAESSLFAKCARRVIEGELWLPKRYAAKAKKTIEPAEGKAPPPAVIFTPREKMIISCLMAGCGNREVARTLSIGVQTVKNHLRTIYDKLGVADRLDVVLYAVHNRLELPVLGSGLGNSISRPKSQPGSGSTSLLARP
jgi:DNA-binding NarL/FixJ family response regulator